MRCQFKKFSRAKRATSGCEAPDATLIFKIKIFVKIMSRAKSAMRRHEEPDAMLILKFGILISFAIHEFRILRRILQRILIFASGRMDGVSKMSFNFLHTL